MLTVIPLVNIILCFCFVLVPWMVWDDGGGDDESLVKTGARPGFEEVG